MIPAGNEDLGRLDPEVAWICWLLTLRLFGTWNLYSGLNDHYWSLTWTVFSGEFSDPASRMSFTNRGFDTNYELHGKEAQLDDIASSSSSSSLPPPEYNKIVQSSPSIYIIGSGDFGRALAGRLAQSGYRVTIASRDGGERNRCVPHNKNILVKSNVKNYQCCSNSDNCIAICFRFSDFPLWTKYATWFTTHHCSKRRINFDISDRLQQRNANKEQVFDYLTFGDHFTNVQHIQSELIIRLPGYCWTKWKTSCQKSIRTRSSLWVHTKL